MSNRISLTAIICLSLSTVLSLTSCTWPDYGYGGTDEVYHYHRYDEEKYETDHEKTWQQNMALDLDHFRKEIDQAWKSAAAKYQPADLTLIDIQWGRVAREFTGGMFADAEDDLVKLKKMMRDMQKKLETHQIMSPKKISGEI